MEDELFSRWTGSCLFGGVAGVWAGVSGGPDSMFLLRALLAFREKGGPEVMAFHMNHGLRAEAADDEAFVADSCARLGVRLVSAREDVASFARERKTSVENAGRILRYRHLLALAGDSGPGWAAATAHHMDDAAETVLMRIIRGTSVAGLVGVRERSGRLIRPLLGLRKEEIVSWMDACGFPYVRDQSNTDPAYTRNRVRMSLMPALARENPRIVEALFRLSASAAGTLAAERAASAPPVIRDGAAEASTASSLSSPARGELLRALARSAGAGEDLSAAHYNAFEAMLASPRSTWSLDMPGFRLVREYELLRAVPGNADEPAAYSFPLSRSAWHFVASAGVCVRTGKPRPAKKNETNTAVVHVDCDRIPADLLLRSRLAGDFFYPSPGTGKSLKKHFIDLKIPRRLRPCVPVIAGAEGTVIAVGTAPPRASAQFSCGGSSPGAMSVEFIFFGEEHGGK